MFLGRESFKVEMFPSSAFLSVRFVCAYDKISRIAHVYSPPASASTVLNAIQYSVSITVHFPAWNSKFIRLLKLIFSCLLSANFAFTRWIERHNGRKEVSSSLPVCTEKQKAKRVGEHSPRLPVEAAPRPDFLLQRQPFRWDSPWHHAPV